MNSLHYITITPKSPIRIGEVKPNFSFLTTDTIIPGSVVRGAVAEYLIARGKESEIKSFIDGMRFGFFYPTPKANVFPLPSPTTALTCKTNRGFKGKEKAHGVFDSLLAIIAYEELEAAGAKFPVPLTFTCPTCESRMERFSGFYIKETNYEKVEVKKFSQTKVAINRRRKTAEKEMLYSITGLKLGNVFVGKVIGDSEKVETVIKALNKTGIGAHTTRGYGKVKATNEVDIRPEDLKSRIELFNEKLNEVWTQVLSIALNKNELLKEPSATYFSVDLLSPTIIKDKGIPTLKMKLNLNSHKLDPVLFSASPTFIGGWSTAWGLPKETIYGAGIGSTYVFKIKEENEELYQKLEKIELEGIGERRDEGYGDVLICHPFHKEVMPI